MLNNRWIHSWPVDLIFMFPAVALIPILALLTWLFQLEKISPGFIILASMFFSPAHLIAPLSLFLSFKTEQGRILKIRPNLIKLMVLISSSVMIVFTIIGILYYLNFSKSIVVIPIALIGAIFFLWNGWHFSMQNFGILQIYRSLAGDTNPVHKKLDLYFSILTILVIPTPFIFNAGMRDNFFTLHFKKFSFTPNVLYIISFLAAINFAIVIYNLFRGPKNIPLILCYVYSLTLTILICVWPSPITLILMSISHWTQELLLTSHIKERTVGAVNMITTKSIFIRVAKLIIFGISIALIYNFLPLFAQNKFVVFGGIVGMFGLNPFEFLLASLLSSVFMVINFLHFLIDTYIYKNRSWAL